MMKVLLDRIGDEGYDLDEVMARAWITDTLGEGSAFRPTAEGHLTAHLERVGRAVHVVGQAVVKLEASCSRCLKLVPLAIDANIHVTLFPRGDEPKATSSGELGEDDLGASTYDGDEIDLANVVRDEVFLELPMTPVCFEDCAGLCPTCGKNLNEGPCVCAPPTDTRWEALRGIKLG